MTTYAEVLPLSGWCNPNRPAFPPSLPSFRSRRPKSVTPFWHTKTHYCMVHGNRAPTNAQKVELNPAAQDFVPNRKQTHNPLGGKLVAVAVMFFERAYGLNGHKRIDHDTLKEEMMQLTGCSERAVNAVLYGSSYNEVLGHLRAQIPGYVLRKSTEIHDPTILPFYNYDACTWREEEAHAHEATTTCCPPATNTEREMPTEQPQIVPCSSISSTAPTTPTASGTDETETDETETSVGEETMEVTKIEEAAKHYPTLILLAVLSVLPLTFLY